MEEVPVRQIGAFIEGKRREGFAVVAVEQTSESVALHEFEFPRKSVLLLGNERAGIPVELIGLVDHCVRTKDSHSGIAYRSSVYNLEMIIEVWNCIFLTLIWFIIGIAQLDSG